jgi:hypothetical protein
MYSGLRRFRGGSLVRLGLAVSGHGNCQHRADCGKLHGSGKVSASWIKTGQLIPAADFQWLAL